MKTMETITMKIEVILILILTLEITRIAFAHKLEYGLIQKEALPSEECDLILVSHSRIEKGDIILYMISLR